MCEPLKGKIDGCDRMSWNEEKIYQCDDCGMVWADEYPLGHHDCPRCREKGKISKGRYVTTTSYKGHCLG